jgi:hypothetical protein
MDGVFGTHSLLELMREEVAVHAGQDSREG